MSSAEPKYGRAWRTAQVIAAGGGAQQFSGDPDELVAEADAARLIPSSGVSVRSMSWYRRAGLVAFESKDESYRIADLQEFVGSMRTPVSPGVRDPSGSDPEERHLELWRLLDGDI
ncbi:MAG TPA: hypothetical protein VGQ36_24235 [Thermoanaerobaculia bacterium]|nr:hypothetical protein [Thermoanaerobaculia bacterium]